MASTPTTGPATARKPPKMAGTRRLHGSRSTRCSRHLEFAPLPFQGEGHTFLVAASSECDFAYPSRSCMVRRHGDPAFWERVMIDRRHLLALLSSTLASSSVASPAFAQAPAMSKPTAYAYS